MASYIDNTKYCGGFNPESLRALAKPRCIKVASVDNDKDIMAVLMQQDNETGCHSWTNDEDISELGSDKTLTTEEPLPAKKPVSSEKNDDQGWEVAGTKGKKGKGHTRLGKKIAKIPNPVTKPAKIAAESAPTCIFKDKVYNVVKDEASSVAEIDDSTWSVICDIFKPFSGSGSSTETASVTAPVKDKDGKFPIPISRLAAEWDAILTRSSKLPLAGAAKETSHAGKVSGNDGLLKPTPKVAYTCASKPVDQVVPLEPASSIQTESMVSTSPATPKTWDWTSEVEEEEEEERVAAEVTKQSEDLPATASPTVSDTVEMIPETTAPAGDHKEDAAMSVASDTYAITQASPSVASTGEHIPKLNASPGLEIDTLSLPKPATKGPTISIPPLDLPTPPSTTGTTSPSSSASPTPKMSRDQRRREKKARQEHLFYDELIDQEMRSTEAITSSSDEATSLTVLPRNAEKIETTEHEQPVQPSLASSTGDADSEAEDDATLVNKPKAKKRGKKGGKKVQKKAAKTATVTQDEEKISTEQVLTELMMEKTQTMYKGYETQVAGLAACSVLFLAVFLVVSLGPQV